MLSIEKRIYDIVNRKWELEKVSEKYFFDEIISKKNYFFIHPSNVSLFEENTRFSFLYNFYISGNSFLIFSDEKEEFAEIIKEKGFNVIFNKYTESFSFFRNNIKSINVNVSGSIAIYFENEEEKKSPFLLSEKVTDSFIDIIKSSSEITERKKKSILNKIENHKKKKENMNIGAMGIRSTTTSLKFSPILKEDLSGFSLSAFSPLEMLEKMSKFIERDDVVSFSNFVISAESLVQAKLSRNSNKNFLLKFPNRDIMFFITKEEFESQEYKLKKILKEEFEPWKLLIYLGGE